MPIHLHLGALIVSLPNKYREAVIEKQLLYLLEVPKKSRDRYQLAMKADANKRLRSQIR